MTKKKYQRTAKSCDFVNAEQGGGKTSGYSNSDKKKNIATTKKTKSKKKNSGDVHTDWIASLARENASNNDGTGSKIPSKEDRKRKRESKKKRRMEQQRQKQLQQQRRRLVATKGSIHGNAEFQPLKAIDPSSASFSSPLSPRKQSQSLSSRKLSQYRLVRLSEILQATRKDLYGETSSAKSHHRPYYDIPRSSNEKASRTSYNNSELEHGKKRKRRKWTEDSIQPLRSDYSGIGLARISLYIEFLDPSYYAKLEEEFREHIPGFFGKQRTKAMKRQTDGNMLWRRLANDKKNNTSKKFKAMSADERVQAMIDASNRSDLLG